jgi:hypothetical protein
MQHPRLNLGLIGFSTEQRAKLQYRLEKNMEQPLSGADLEEDVNFFNRPVWRISDYREANALLLNTEQARWDAAHVLRFHSDPQHPNLVGVRPSELAVPYGISGTCTQELRAVLPSNVLHVVMEDEASVQRAFQNFEALLRPLRTAYALAYHLIDRRRELDNGHTFHLIRNSVLVAVVDVPLRRIAMRDGLRPVDLDDAAWQRRPSTAHSPPEGFSVWMIEEVEWIYAMHCKQFVLPTRYQRKPIYLRRLPRVRAGMLYPRHNRLLQWLGEKPRTYEFLSGVWQDGSEQLMRDLYALYLCRAITTSTRQSKYAYEGPAASEGTFFVASDLDSDANSELPTNDSLGTAPAGLQ